MVKPNMSCWFRTSSRSWRRNWFGSLLYVLSAVVAVPHASAKPSANGLAAVNQLRPDGKLLNWIVLGPFHSEPLDAPLENGVSRGGYHQDFLTALGGEAQAVLTSGTFVMTRNRHGVEARRQASLVETWENGHLRYSGFDEQTGYAFCCIHSGKNQTAYLYFGSDGSPKVWLNGDCVIRGWRDKHITRVWEYGEKVQLKAGSNLMLVKLDNARGWWGFQAYLIPEADHAVAVRGKFQALKPNQKGFSAVTATKDDEINVTISPRPSPLDFDLPIRVELVIQDSNVVASATGKTGKRITLKLPPDYKGTAKLLMNTTSGAEVELAGEHPFFVGDFEAERNKLKARLIEAQKDMSFLSDRWRRVHIAMIPWLEDWLERGLDPDGPIEADLANMDYARTLIGALTAGRNIFTEYPEWRFPALHTWTDEKGKPCLGEFLITFPPAYATNTAPLPLVISLHGSGGRGRTLHWSMDKLNGDYADRYGMIQVEPHSPVWWRTEQLEGMLDAILEEFAVDEERVYLTGFSMGGIGSWAWGSRNPERFAAVAPKAGWGNCIMVRRLRHVPVWMVQGERDTTVPPCHCEMCVTALQRAGGLARYSLLSEEAHHVPPAFNDKLYAWFLTHKRTGIEPPDPLETFNLDTNGMGPITIKTVPERPVVALPIRVPADQLLQKWDHKEVARIYVPYRRMGRMADRPVEFHIPNFALGKKGDITGEYVLPVDIEVDVTGMDLTRRSDPPFACASFIYAGERENALEIIASARERIQELGHRPADALRIVALSDLALVTDPMVVEIQIGIVSQ